MKTILKIKWENIITILMTITTIFGWITFIRIPDVYTLALAVIPTIMTLVVIMLNSTIAECRKQILDLWQ